MNVGSAGLFYVLLVKMWSGLVIHADGVLGLKMSIFVF